LTPFAIPPPTSMTVFILSSDKIVFWLELKLLLHNIIIPLVLAATGPADNASTRLNPLDKYTFSIVLSLNVLATIALVSYLLLPPSLFFLISKKLLNLFDLLYY
jgi:hypothetical protein